MKVCVIGMGPIGNRHAKLYRENPAAELVGVCDIRADRAAAGGQAFGVPHFSDAREMLQQLKPALVSVATGGYEYGSSAFSGGSNRMISVAASWRPG